jgi:hypothetical protein
MTKPIIISDADRTLGNVVLNHESMLIEDGSTVSIKSLWGFGGSIDVNDSNVTLTGPALTSDTINLVDGSHLTVGAGDSLTFLAPVTLDGSSTVEFLGATLAERAQGVTYDASTGQFDIFSAKGRLLADLNVHVPTGYTPLAVEAGGGPPSAYSGLYIAAHFIGGVTPSGALSGFTGVTHN